MSNNINKKIVDKINESDEESSIKEFLIKLLVFELDNAGEARWRFSEKYDSAIKFYSDKFKGGKK